MTMPIIIAATPLFRIELDERVDAHDGDARLDGALQLLDLAHAGLEHAGLDAVVHLAARQIEPVVLIPLGLGEGLGVGVLGLFGGCAGGRTRTGRVRL